MKLQKNYKEGEVYGIKRQFGAFLANCRSEALHRDSLKIIFTFLKGGKMGEKRAFPRYPMDKQLKGRYFLEGVDRSWEECSILNVSHIGVCVLFQTEEAIDPGSTINLEIEIPGESKPINAKGVLKWIYETGNVHKGGVEFSSLLDESEWLKLIRFMS